MEKCACMQCSLCEPASDFQGRKKRCLNISTHDGCSCCDMRFSSQPSHVSLLIVSTLDTACRVVQHGRTLNASQNATTSPHNYSEQKLRLCRELGEILPSHLGIYKGHCDRIFMKQAVFHGKYPAGFCNHGWKRHALAADFRWGPAGLPWFSKRWTPKTATACWMHLKPGLGRFSRWWQVATQIFFFQNFSSPKCGVQMNLTHF